MLNCVRPCRQLRVIRSGSALSTLSHVDAATGKPQMVDVSVKAVSARTAVAKGRVLLSHELVSALASTQFNQAEVLSKKGPVFATAIIAGVQAVKKTAELIPFCHSINMESIKIDIDLQALDPRSEPSGHASYSHAANISCLVKCEGKTGVEMEALVGVTHAALCVYDMLKGLSHDMLISDVHLVSKTGGKSDIRPK